MKKIKIRCFTSSVMGDRYVKTSPDTTILYSYANIFYGWAMSEPLSYKNFGITICVFLRGILETETDIFEETGYFIEGICVFPKPLELTLWTSFYPTTKRLTFCLYAFYFAKNLGTS